MVATDKEFEVSESYSPTASLIIMKSSLKLNSTLLLDIDLPKKFI